MEATWQSKAAGRASLNVDSLLVIKPSRPLVDKQTG